VRYREAGAGAGAGATVIIIAGLGLSSRFYIPNITGLAQRGLHVVVPDLPGFGASSGRYTGLSVEEAARWCVSFADAVGARRAVWVGHSIGRQIAIAVAATHPERASALILTGPTGARGGRGSRLVHQIASLSRVALYEGPAVLWAVTRDYVHTTPWHYAGWWLRAGSDRPLERASAVRVPALILIGDRDPVPTKDFIAELAQRLPNARVDRVPHAYHALPIEQPDEFNRRVAEFVRSSG